MRPEKKEIAIAMYELLDAVRHLGKTSGFLGDVWAVKSLFGMIFMCF